jgi:hypothetical protein
LIGNDFSDYFIEPDRARAGYQKVIQEGIVKHAGVKGIQASCTLQPDLMLLDIQPAPISHRLKKVVLLECFQNHIRDMSCSAL